MLLYLKKKVFQGERPNNDGCRELVGGVGLCHQCNWEREIHTI